MDDRDGEYRSRGQSPRRRPYDAYDTYESGDSGDAPPRNPSRDPRDPRDPRDMSGPRSRPPRRDYDDDYASREQRPSSRGGPRSRPDEYAGYDRRSPAGSSSSSGRRRDGENETYDRSSRYGGSSSGRGDRRGGDNYDRYEPYDRSSRSSRSSRYDPSGSSPRAARPRARDDEWADPRAGVRGPVVADSNSRMRRPPQQGYGGRGGLWDDGQGGANPRNLRAQYRQNQAPEEEEEEGSTAAGFVKGLGAIILALILGVGAAYGYYVVSAPHLNVPASQQVAPTAPASTPSTTPSTTPSPSATKSALLPSGKVYILTVG